MGYYVTESNRNVITDNETGYCQERRVLFLMNTNKKQTHNMPCSLNEVYYFLNDFCNNIRKTSMAEVFKKIKNLQFDNTTLPQRC